MNTYHSNESSNVSDKFAGFCEKMVIKKRVGAALLETNIEMRVKFVIDNRGEFIGIN